MDLALGLTASWVLMLCQSFLYILICPYTKVEESFNLQAMHDLIYYGLDVDKFDHMEFPGAVPRTFVGALSISYICKPIVLLLNVIGFDKFSGQYTVRAILCSCVLLAFLHLLVSVKRLYGQSTAIWTALITASQFHFLFYASRPLPNTFAAIFAVLALSYWLRSRFTAFIFWAGWTIIVFRCELALMFGLMLLITLMYGKFSLTKLITRVFLTGLIALATTVLIDSFFWQFWIWPEGFAFYFNAILNKSSEWGTSPLLWYFYSALPRALGTSLLLVPLAMAVDRRCLVMCLPAFGFVSLYSLLPHKELRFIIYVVPVLNIAVARVCSVIWLRRSKVGWKHPLAALLVVSHLMANAMITAFLLKLSYHNYPGGETMHTLHKITPLSADVNVHIDIYTAQTGISRFLHMRDNWQYDKTENMTLVADRLESYSHLLRGTPDEDQIEKKIDSYKKTHRVVRAQHCFKRIEFLGITRPPFLDIILQPCVWLLVKR